MEIKLENFLKIADLAKDKNNVGGRGQKVKQNKMQIAIKLDKRSRKILDEFCDFHGLEKTQTIEALIELLPYLHHQINYKD